MRKRSLAVVLGALAGFAPSSVVEANSSVHVTYLWHLHQPIYWPDHVPGLNRYQFGADSVNIKKANGNRYAGDPFVHPRNALADEGGEYDQVFTKDDRILIYQNRGREAIQSLFGHGKAGAQVSYSGALMENVRSFGKDYRYGYTPSWNDGYRTARGWTTTGGKRRADMVGMTYHHAFSPLLPKSVFRKEVQIFKEIWWKSWGGNPDKSDHSKGFWPVECAFSESLIPVLREEGYNWSIIANSHLARTCANYMDVAQRGNSGWNIDPPNKADMTGPSVPANQWWQGTIDGRGGAFPAPFAYQAHKAKYVDPENGFEHKITVVPMCDLLSYQNGYGSMGTGEIDAKIAPFNNPNQPSIVLMAHDGDNAWGGGASYYQESVPGFMNQAASKGYEPTVIEQFLADHPVPDSDVVNVEDGAWVNAANDWGHPQFINWMWPPMRTNGDPASVTTDPRTWIDVATGWTEDFRNWAVLIAGANYCETAEQITKDQGTSVNAWKIQEPYQNNGTYNNPNNAELAWHFYLGGLDSGFMYYGTSLDDEVKQAIACNRSLNFAAQVVGNGAQDRTPPTIFKPQRYPWNPGGMGWGPNTGYRAIGFNGNAPWPSEFTVWTHVYDVSGVTNVTLWVRADNDGVNPVNNNDNETFVGGSSVGSWIALPMNKRVLSKSFNGNNSQITFFEEPINIADTYYAKVTGYKNKLVDYYVSAFDGRGHLQKSDIQHVWVADDGSVTNPPAIPQNLVASSGGTNRIQLGWSSSAAASSYIIRRDGVVIGSSLTTSFSNTGLPSGSSFCYTVAASNAVGVSAESTIACATTDAIVLPEIPEDLVATSLGIDRVSLMWSSASGTVSYIVRRDGVRIASPTGTTCTATGLWPSVTYCFTVASSNQYGVSADSTPKCATTDDVVPPESPANLVATSGAPDRIQLTWSPVSNAVTYILKRDGIRIASPATTSYTATGLTANTEYCFTIAVSNQYAASTDSVSQCATTLSNAPLNWIGKTYNWPLQGQITSNTDFWVNTETSPKGAALAGTVTYSTNNGTTWITKAMGPNGTSSTNDFWNALLGKFPAGTSIRYKVALSNAVGTTLTDDNAGAFHRARVNTGLAVNWIGNVYHWPPSGQITSTTDLWVNIESWPAGTAMSASIVYTTNGTTWLSKEMNLAGRTGNNDWWNINLGKFPAGTTVRYAIKVTDGQGTAKWANNNGANYMAVVK